MFRSTPPQPISVVKIAPESVPAPLGRAIPGITATQLAIRTARPRIRPATGLRLDVRMKPAHSFKGANARSVTCVGFATRSPGARRPDTALRIDAPADRHIAAGATPKVRRRSIGRLGKIAETEKDASPMIGQTLSDR